MVANHVLRASALATGPTNLEKAVHAWGEALPQWVRLLAETCDRSGQRRVGDLLGIDSSHVSRLIRNCYTGSLANAEERVRARLASDEVDCPLWGAIPLGSCIRERKRKGPPQNAAQIALANTCPTCPNNRAAPHNGDAL